MLAASLPLSSPEQSAKEASTSTTSSSASSRLIQKPFSQVLFVLHKIWLDKFRVELRLLSAESK
jgi:hypothetical protein